MTTFLTVVIYASFAVAFLAALSLAWTGVPKAPVAYLDGTVSASTKGKSGRAHPIFDVQVTR